MKAFLETSSFGSYDNWQNFASYCFALFLVIQYYREMNQQNYAKANQALFNPTLHIVLDRPKIAANIASIVRLATGGQAAVHICGPLVFDKTDKTKWRAGLDYFYGARVHFHANLHRCLKLLGKAPWIVEVGGELAPWDVIISPGDIAVFGPEDDSVLAEVIASYPKRVITLPQAGPVRSLNLAQCAAVMLFESIRQFSG